MAEPGGSQRREVLALRVRQWLPEWNSVKFDPKAHRRKPDPHFFMFAMPAADLKSLTGIQRRSTATGLQRASDLGIQRRHDPERSELIQKFVRNGYPWSDPGARPQAWRTQELKNPGWLPTAVVVNIRVPDRDVDGAKLHPDDIIEIVDEGSHQAKLKLPTSFGKPNWAPKGLHPIEVIDGQHRLWAFENEVASDDYELPVVAFHGLDIGWQAYLFWVINMRPKRINASLAFDLYPLLRIEEWLERTEEVVVYRETRAQELTEALWGNSNSPWFQRINMLGEPGQKNVTQAAWIRSLIATFIKSSQGQGIKIGGLFGAPVGSERMALPWSRAQQAAFLIFAWQLIRDAVRDSQSDWATELRLARKGAGPSADSDPAFSGPVTLLNSDPGVRGVLFVTNDLVYVHASDLKLKDWIDEPTGDATHEQAVNNALAGLARQPVGSFLTAISLALAKYDWRTSAAPGLDEQQRIAKLAFRGSGGYRELRRQLLYLLAKETGEVGEAANTVIRTLGY